MNKNLSIPLIGASIENLEPDVSDLTWLLIGKGFEHFTKERAQKIPVGSLILIHSEHSGGLLFALVQEHIFWKDTYLGFRYSTHNHSQTSGSSESLKTFDNFKQKFFKVITQLEAVDGIPQAEELPDKLNGIGFKDLANATPEDLSSGDLVFLYDKNSGIIEPIIVRVLSHQFADDHRLLFWRQSAIVAGTWQYGVIMGHLSPFNNYSYFVF